jgi:hypothetical protein
VSITLFATEVLPRDYWAATPDRPVQRYPAGRVCARPRCHTVLSIYSKGPKCCRHTAPELRIPDDSHGTEAAYKVHFRRGERPCNACTDAATLATAERKRKAGLKRGYRPAGSPILHGTESGYQTHRRRNEKPCDACREAIRLIDAARREKRRAKA